MSWLLTMLVGNAAVAIPLSLLALVAAWRRRPALAHGLWLLVLIKLVTPPIFHLESAWGISRQKAPIAIAIEEPISAVTPVHRATEPATAIRRESPAVKATPLLHAPGGGEVQSVSTPLRREIPMGWIVCGVWVIGSVVYALGVGWRVRRFCGLLKQTAPAGGEVRRMVADVGAAMGVTRAVEVCVVAPVASPMVLWLGRALVVMPREVVERLSIAQQRAIVAHELAHLRRGDHWVRWIETAAMCLLWWHPLLWLARWGLHEAEEQCCDAWVVAMLPAEGRRVYADALVDVLEMTCAAPALPVGASGLGRMTHLKRRITMILDRTPAKSLSFPGKVAMALLAAALLPLALVRADAPAKPGSNPTSGLASVDDSTRKAIESLLETAQDPNEQVKMAAVGAITRFGPKAVPVLIDALGREKEAPLAQSLLSQMGIDAIEGLIETIDSPAPPAVRERALLAIEAVLQPGGAGAMGEGGGAPGGFAPPGRAAPGVAPAAFGAAGPQPLMFSGMVASAYPAPNVMSFAIWSVTPASKASADASAAVRRAAVRVLGAISNITFDPAVAKALASALKDEDPSVRRVAAGAMVNVARFAPEVASALAAGVNDSDQSVRVSAINALGSLGSRGKQSMPALTAALKDANPDVRIAAANALGAMQVPQEFNLVAAINPGANGIPAMPPPVANPDGSFPVQAIPMPPAPGSPEALVYAQNVWHWTKLGRYDQAKAEADRIIKSDEGTLLNAFAQVAQERNESLEGWLKRNAGVKELKELVTQLQKAIDNSRPAQPPSTQAIFQDEGAPR
jgi:beta-lactamase regulating signal transducer with metallopeptidase domain/HEAT repeat protein